MSLDLCALLVLALEHRGGVAGDVLDAERGLAVLALAGDGEEGLCLSRDRGAGARCALGSRHREWTRLG